MPLPLQRERSIIDARYTLKYLFKKTSFRPGQEDIINASLAGEDILVIFPVGHGKSLTYQLPAVVSDHGCTLVISPLLALMENQVNDLRKQNINAVTLNSNVNYEDRKVIFDDLACGHPRIRLLYVSPELCATTSFRNIIDILYKHGELNRIVVDEAHCCVEWGHSFRKHYTQLGYFKQTYPNLPISALTATAPAELRQEIINILKLPSEPDLKVFTSTSNRPNIHYEVRFLSGNEVIEDIMDFLKRYSIPTDESSNRYILRGSGIIYCRQRNTTELLAEQLRNAGFGAQAFHGQLKNQQEKSKIMNKWIDNNHQYQVIVATVAFGMGVDKPDVRFVIHYDLPNNFESYYQGSGRAGRDNKAARSILYYSRNQAMLLTSLKSKELILKQNKKLNRLQSEQQGVLYLIDYCEEYSKCKHVMIGQYFDKVQITDTSWCNYACDYCKNKEALKRRRIRAIPHEKIDMIKVNQMSNPFDYLYNLFNEQTL